LTNATNALEAANSKATVTVSSSAPSDPNAGDIWYDSSTTPAQANVWNGTDWEPADAAAQSQAQAALDAANAASALAGTKAVVTISGTIPASAAKGDVWQDTALTPQVTYVCKTAYASGGTVATNWQQTADPVAQSAATSAQSTASTALTTAQAAAVTKTLASIPASAKLGDFWYDTAVTPQATFICTTAYSSGGSLSDWTAVDAAAQQIANDAATAASTAQTTANTANTAAGNAQTTANQANTAAGNAQTTANSKAKSTYSSTVPASAAVGDLWFDTAVTPKASFMCITAYSSGGSISNYLALDTAALSVANAASTAASNAQTTANNANTAAGTAQTTANSKAKGYVQNTIPTSANLGDVWTDTALTPPLVYTCSTAYSSGGTVAANWKQADAAASNAAATAQSTANAAQSTANGKNKVQYSTSAPTTSSPGIPGDIWFKWDSSHIIQAQYFCTAGTGTSSGNTWSSSQITGAVLTNLDAGTITTGSLNGIDITLTYGNATISLNPSDQYTGSGQAVIQMKSGISSTWETLPAAIYSSWEEDTQNETSFDDRLTVVGPSAKVGSTNLGYASLQLSAQSSDTTKPTDKEYSNVTAQLFADWIDLSANNAGASLGPDGNASFGVIGGLGGQVQVGAGGVSAGNLFIADDDGIQIGPWASNSSVGGIYIDTSGNVQIPQVPTQPYHAASKAYVDDYFTDSGWITVGSGGTAPAYASGMSDGNTAADYRTRFRKVGNWVTVALMCTKGATSVNIFTLPAGYAPTYTMITATWGTTGVLSGFIIRPTGSVEWVASALTNGSYYGSVTYYVG